MIKDNSHYQPPDATLWQGRTDSLPGERFFQRVTCLDVQKQPLPKAKRPLILGFCSDEGIVRNQGRPGAKEGPTALRQQLAKLAYQGNKQFLDIGNVVCHNHELENAQQQFAALIDYCHRHHHRTIAFGGGHEIAWPHYLGLSNHYPNLGIINVDAHFDIRPVLEGQYATSGSPFWQIKQHCNQQQLAFDYCCLGIQASANTKSLFNTAQDWNVRYLTANEINSDPLSKQTDFLEDFICQHEQLYLTICLDVFSISHAPGVSAPQALGLFPWQVIPLLKYIVQTGKVVSIDIAELSPPLDPTEVTSRLAAALIAELLQTQGM